MTSVQQAMFFASAKIRPLKGQYQLRRPLSQSDATMRSIFRLHLSRFRVEVFPFFLVHSVELLNLRNMLRNHTNQMASVLYTLITYWTIYNATKVFFFLRTKCLPRNLTIIFGKQLKQKQKKTAWNSQLHHDTSDIFAFRPFPNQVTVEWQKKS